MRNLKLIVAYDGTRFFGWQKTKMGPSIEETLKQALETITGHPVKLQAASRTDRGVHAKGQVVNFFTSSSLPLDRLRHSFNALLPREISILSIEEALENFHPTLEAKSKEYRYTLSLGPVQLPFFRDYAWHFPYPLDLPLIEEAIPLLLGKRDFAAFCNQREEDTVREIFSINLTPLPYHQLEISIAGNNFLYKMVRNLVGTLVYVGCRKIDISTIPKILLSRDRSLAGVTAPAKGLVLQKVFYD